MRGEIGIPVTAEEMAGQRETGAASLHKSYRTGTEYRKEQKHGKRYNVHPGRL
jgi:hypothetical protein